MRCFPRAKEEAMSALRQALPSVSNGEVLDGELAFEYFLTVRSRMIELATEAAAHYHSETWLRLIRRLSPHALSYTERGTTEYQGDSTQRVAENLVGTADGEVLDVSAAVSTTVAMRLARLMAIAYLVDSLESDIRSVSKGVKYRMWSRRHPIPTDSRALQEALREFDLRSTWSSVEKTPHLAPTSTTFAGDPTMLVAYRFEHGIAMDQTWSGPFRSASAVTMPVQFTLRSFDTDIETHTELRHPGVLASFENPSQTASLVVFGHTLLDHVLFTAEEAGQTLPHLGVMEMDSGVLLAELGSVLQRPALIDWLAATGQSALTPQAVLDHVNSLYEHGRRSFPGPVIQERVGKTLIDVWAYSWHVSDGLKLSPHTGGVIANLSAEQFELAAQDAIDSSVLAPPPELRALRGRVLRLNGRPITDVDAILVSGTKLFLVSCKRFIIRVDYLAGDYLAARNATSRLNGALDEWRERIARFQEFPVGDNYDFSGYEIQGFVLLPQLVFTPRSDAKEMLQLDGNKCFFTRVESFAQFSATLEMAGWPHMRRPQ